MAIGKRLRYEILRRDNHACRYCGGAAPDVKLTVDHVVPVALGGTDDPTNLVASCVDCNAGKSSTGPDEKIVVDVATDALLWEHVTALATEKLRADREACAEFGRSAWNIWNEWCGARWSIPDDCGDTFERWYERGVTLDDILYAAQVTSGSRGVEYHWAYFCGIVAKHLKKRDELARQMLDDSRQAET